MKKKVFSLMMMLLLAVTGIVRADELTVNDGSTTNSYVPVYGFYADAYLKCEYVVPAEALADMVGADISQMTYYAATPASDSWGVASFQVFMKEVDITTISAFQGMDGATMVYEGPLDGTQATMEIAFSEPYHYSGGNLLVGIYNTVKGTYKSISWSGEAVDGASYQGYSYTSLEAVSGYQRNFLPKTTFTYAGGGGAGSSDQLHVKYMEGEEEIIDALNMGVRPVGAWMEPFEFTMYTDGRTYTVNVLDFTPSDGMFTVAGEELPFQVVRNNDVALTMVCNGTEAGVIERQFVAITEGDRAAHIWPITVELYAPEVPDVWEKACTEATTFPFVEVPATAHNIALHNDYTLPFPEIPEGYDAVYKLVFTEDQMLDASVTYGENGKVALYREGFEGEGGPMATNYYTGLGMNEGGAAASPFEAQIGEGTTTFGYFPFYTLYNYSIAENLFLATELEAAGVTTAPMTSLSWYATNAPGYAQQGISIWMANVDDESLTTTSHVVTDMTLVYTGAMTPEIGWNEFAFNEGNFAWDGHSNILIYCQRNNGSWNSTVYWASTPSMPFNASAYKYQDSAAYDATVPQTMTTSTTRPNIIMKADGRRNRTLEAGIFASATGNNGRNAGNVGMGNRDGWYYYDNGTNADAIGLTNGGSFYWGVMFPAGSYTGNKLTKVSMYDYSAHTGTISVYQGGSDAPGTLVGSQAYTCTGSENFVEWTLSSPITINPAQNLWIVMNNNNGQYVASCCDNTGSANGRWISTDGAEWFDLADAGLDYTWMIRAYVETAGGPTPPTPPTPGSEIEYVAGPVIENLPVTPGTYYLVASSTTEDFEVTINAEDMPCPIIEGFAFNPIPADNADAIEPASVTLSWSIPAYATGWRLIFGSTYHPEPNHPQTIMYPEDGSFTNQMANSYTVRNLWNNTNYFWRVEFNNGSCEEGVSSPVWGFTTHLNVPQGLTAVDETVFDDESIVLNWNAVVDRTYRMYNVYRDGELIGHTQVNNIGNTTYTDGPLAYNMDGYTYYVTAVYDEGESAPSNTVNVKVSGYGNVDGHVYEQDGTTGIAGATVTMVGLDEFNVSHTYNFQTNGQGYYSGHIYAGSYNGSAACNGYQTINEPVQGNPIAMVYNQTTSPIDYILDENFDPVCGVIAEYYPDSLDPQSPYVKVYWGCGLPGSEIIEDFETGDFSMFDWQVDPTYPWTVTTNNPYEGTYCMKSGGAGVPNVVSNMTVTVDIPADGIMSFFGKISSESSWDYGYFYIDGVQKGSYTGQGNWGEKKFDITEGTHTFQWRYTKDGSVNSYDDCFYVDYISFYKQPEPVGPGWHTYLESDFDNAYRSNVGDPSWGYEYPTSVLAQYAGYNLTKVAVFSDDMYGAVGGNFTCNVYKGGSTPGAGTLAASITVDVPVGLGAWCEYDLNNAVNVTGTEPLWVIWTVNTYGGMGYPAGCASHSSAYGDWWNNGQDGWQHMDGATWTMKNYFTNRGRTVVLGDAELAHAPMTEVMGSHINSNLRTFEKGEVDKTAESINPNAVTVPMTSIDNTRALSHYRVYRTNCYNDGPYTEENTVLLATVWVPDTVYIDVEWADLPAGVYKWGVGTVYEGNRGEEIAGPISWSEPVNVRGDRDLMVDFESGLPTGWTVIDANNDGYTWCLTSAIPTTWTYYASLTLDWYHSGTNAICSGSYINGVGAVTPDEYLVSPQVNLGNGSSISFWVAATDASYPADHFGVFVSDDMNNWTSVQEWTLTGKKSGMMGGFASRDGNGLRLGTWYNYTVDLSAYAGQKYVAFRHFNCYDQYIMCLDDITIIEGAGGPTPPTPPTPGNTGLQLPRESEIVWSNCLDKDMWLGENEVDVTVLLNSADSPEGVTVSFENLNEAEQEMYPVADVVLDETGFYAWDTFRKGDYKVSVTFDGYEPIEENVSIWEPTSLRYVMIEIIYGVDNLYVSRTGWAMWDAQGLPNPGGGGGGGGQGGSGDTFECGFENGLEGWTTIDNDGNGLNWVNSVNSTSASGYDYTGLAHGGNYFVYSQSYIDYQGAYEADNYLVTPQKYSIVNGSTLTFWADNANDSYPDHFAIAISTADTPTAASFTDVWSHQGAKGEGKSATRHDGARYQNWRSHSVDLSAYAGQNVWIAFHHQDYDEYEIWIDDVALTTGAKDGDRHLEGFKVLCTSIDGEPIFNTNTVHPFCQVATDELVEGEHYICKVAAIYSTGMSDWTEAEWEYESCEHYAGTVNGVAVDGNTITWDYPGGGTGPTPPGQGDSFNVDFEGGMPTGWTVVDANNDGYTWCLTSAIPTTWTYYASLTLDWYHGGTNAICSGSYINGVGALNPDEYLISPQVTLAAGSQLSFWVAATDASYAADHFGVFVSTTGTNPSDFQSVQEWTLTGKKSGVMGGSASRDGRGERLGTWYNYTVDLGAFAGQAYIAFRHFNCYDQYIMCLDDITLSSGGKGNRAPWDLMATFNAAEAAQYGVATDGQNIYTCNWGYSSATWNFYKYDMQGNMIEGFNVAGCGTIRDLTYDGQYFYGGANSSVLYCIDLANHNLISSTSTTCSGIRHCSYDPVNDGFWVGGWSDLKLIDRTGATITNGPAVESVSGSGYYEDEDGNPHLYLFTQAAADAKVYDYNILTNTVGAMLKDFSTTPGYDAGSSGGAFIGEYNGKIAFFGDVQQSPNLIGIYELRDAGTGPTPPPTPSGDIVGAMIFVDGEWEAFVPAPTNSYTYEGDGNEICVRIVYNGAAELPSNNYYYAMSCEECEEINPVGPGTCEPGAPIHAEQLSDQQIKVWWGEEPAAPVEDWLYYDDGTNEDAIGLTNGGSFYWGIKFPAASLSQYAGCSVTKVAYYDYTAHTGTVRIYNGSNGNAPGTLIGTYNYTANGTEDWVEWNIPAVAFDNTQDLWIVMNNSNGQYVAALGPYTGDPNGTMISTDGSTWYTLSDATGGQLTGTWNIRAFVSNQAKGGEIVALEDVKNGTENAVIANAGVAKHGSFPMTQTRASIVKYNVYRSTDPASGYVMIGEVAETGASYYEYIDMPVEAGTYYYQVRAYYDNDCESEPAVAADDPSHNYVSGSTVGDGLVENDANVALYPNPTNGNVTIEANGMSRITVVSVLGQVVYDTELNADSYTLNMGQFNAGLYMVRVYTESGVTVKRVTVMQ